MPIGVYEFEGGKEHEMRHYLIPFEGIFQRVYEGKLDNYTKLRLTFYTLESKDSTKVDQVYHLYAYGDVVGDPWREMDHSPLVYSASGQTYVRGKVYMDQIETVIDGGDLSGGW
jgi:hypothetical protein